MILDTLENSNQYHSLHDGFAQAFAFLSRPGLEDVAVGRYEIDGERIFAMVAQEAGRAKEGALLEAHERYIDIQYILAGTDTMGWKPRSLCHQPTCDYDPQADIRFFADQPDAWVDVVAGAFAIFFPEDAHMPLISAAPIRKVVVKIAVTP